MTTSPCTMKYGKYAGHDIRDVPTEYLEWLLESQKSTGEQIEGELERRRLAEEANQSWLEKVIGAGYRSLAKQHHPDRGGDPEAMKELNAAVAKLRGMLGKNGDGDSRL
jgi:Putative quorum-sensing-regulated virulence factor